MGNGPGINSWLQRPKERRREKKRGKFLSWFDDLDLFISLPPPPPPLKTFKNGCRVKERGTVAKITNTGKYLPDSFFATYFPPFLCAANFFEGWREGSDRPIFLPLFCSSARTAIGRRRRKRERRGGVCNFIPSSFVKR